MDKEVTKMTTVLDIIMIDQLMHLWVHATANRREKQTFV